MNSDHPERPITPYAPFSEVPRSVTPASMQAVSEVPASTRASEFPKAIQDAIDLMEQSLIANVQSAMRKLGTAVLAQQARIEGKIEGRFAALEARAGAHATELRALRGALEQRQDVMLPPPPDNL